MIGVKWALYLFAILQSRLQRFFFTLHLWDESFGISQYNKRWTFDVKYPDDEIFIHLFVYFYCDIFCGTGECVGVGSILFKMWMNLESFAFRDCWRYYCLTNAAHRVWFSHLIKMFGSSITPFTIVTSDKCLADTFINPWITLSILGNIKRKSRGTCVLDLFALLIPFFIQCRLAENNFVESCSVCAEVVAARMEFIHVHPTSATI